MRTVRRLRLRFFFFLQGCACAVHSFTCCPVETMQAHQKHTLVGFDTYTIPAINGATTYCAITCAYGGPGGIRTPVQNTFLFASYSNN